MSAFDLLAAWPAPPPAAGVVGTRQAAVGPADEVRPWASVTKPVFAYAVLRLAEAGRVDLDEPCGPPGATVRHLLAHASGLGPDTREPLCAPGTRRIYSNAGYEVLGELLAERTGQDVENIIADLVLSPLGMARTRLIGSPAHGLRGPLTDLLRFTAELLEPRLVAVETLRSARSVAFPGLSGVLPGFGRQEPNDWGLGFEIRDAKTPHWTAPANSPETFGHFGRSGSFFWIDPVARIGCAVLAGTEFGPWAVEAWPRFSAAVLDEFGSHS